MRRGIQVRRGIGWDEREGLRSAYGGEGGDPAACGVEREPLMLVRIHAPLALHSRGRAEMRQRVRTSAQWYAMCILKDFF